MSFNPSPQDAQRPETWLSHSPVSCQLEGRVLDGVLELPLGETSDVADLRCRYRTLRSAYEGRGMAMAVAGHDLRQPLQVIGMVLARLAARAGDERDLSWLAIANGEIARLSAGLDHLAVLSRDDDCTSGGPAIGDLCVDTVLREVSTAWRHHARAKGLRLTVVSTGLTVTSNTRLLSVILGNLVSNAIKYTEQGGVVLGCRRRGEAVVIEIVDTGRGFSNSTEAVFSPFWREDTDDAGLGLGLSIVRRTADLLGHKVVIRSERGSGSRVGVVMARGLTAV